MITEIPTPEEFKAAALNQLHLSWQIATRAMELYNQAADWLDDDDLTEAATDYWKRSQPALANAFSLIQQSIELGLKGRIAAISPYLLIARDPKDWPKGVESKRVPFSDFRTLDAADLIKVHNTFSSDPLDDRFRTVWDNVRRDRNKVMHTVSERSFEPGHLVRTILIVAKTLFGEQGWPRRLIDMEEQGSEAALGVVEYTFNTVLTQVGLAMQVLQPAEKRDLLGHDHKRRDYLCPTCFSEADRGSQEQWPHLAQLKSRAEAENALRCIVCETVTEVKREPCNEPGCEGSVIFEERCLTCHAEQDDPSEFESGLDDPRLDFSHTYHMTFRRGERTAQTTRCFSGDKAAIEHAERALRAPHLSGWTSVTIQRALDNILTTPGERGIVGRWVRSSERLEWEDGRTAHPNANASPRLRREDRSAR